MESGRRRVIVIDDHPLYALGVGVAIATIASDISVQSCAMAYELERIEPDADIALILLDLRLPETIGLSSIEFVKARFPHVPLCVMSGQTDAGSVRQILAQDVAGFLPKTLPYDGLIKALSKLLAGERLNANPVRSDHAEGMRLSPAEERIMHELCLGVQNKQIAFDLGISESTVKSHLARIFTKLRVSNRSQAILAFEHIYNAHDHGDTSPANDIGTSPAGLYPRPRLGGVDICQMSAGGHCEMPQRLRRKRVDASRTPGLGVSPFLSRERQRRPRTGQYNRAIASLRGMSQRPKGTCPTCPGDVDRMAVLC